MASKKKASKEKPLLISPEKDESDDEALARTFLMPELHAAVTTSRFAEGLFPDVALPDLVTALEKETEKTSSGDLGRCEATLVAQAATLDAIFHQLIRKSFSNLNQHFEDAESLLKLALRSQSQCRVTMESLATFKQPPADIIRQTNIAHGHQQVNNFPEKENPPNELLEKTDGERLDTGTPREAVKVDPDLATVEAKHRTKNG